MISKISAIRKLIRLRFGMGQIQPKPDSKIHINHLIFSKGFMPKLCTGSANIIGALKWGIFFIFDFSLLLPI